MDGAEPATPNIAAGQDFTYRFSVPNSGTYWAHPHTGLDEDTGLYLPVIVDDPTEGNYDAEWIVVLDDWTDGVGKSSPTALQRTDAARTSPRCRTCPTRRLDDLDNVDDPTTSTTSTTSTTYHSTSQTTSVRARQRRQLDASAQGSVGKSDLLGGDAGDIAYPYYLINGRIPERPHNFQREAGPANPDPFHQHRLRHHISRGAGRPFDDGHPHRRLPRGAQLRSMPCSSAWPNATTSS